MLDGFIAFASARCFFKELLRLEVVFDVWRFHHCHLQQISVDAPLTLLFGGPTGRHVAMVAIGTGTLTLRFRCCMIGPVAVVSTVLLFLFLTVGLMAEVCCNSVDKALVPLLAGVTATALFLSLTPMIA